MVVKTPKTSDVVAISIVILLILPVLYFSVFVPFETDTGDSIVHYFFAHYAFQEPILYFDHWAKPFFTLLASPFAQFGFEGLKLFNGITGLLSAWIAYLISKKLDLKYAWLAIICVFFSPTYFVELFSGYTEPLFGLVLIASIYLILVQRPLYSAVLVSFLPFVRSEGLVIIMVFTLFFLIRKNFKAIVLLPAGHLLYSFAGLLAGKKFFWVFSEIPYSVSSVYGKGNFTHYPQQLLITLGVPIFLLFIIGIVSLLANMVTKKIQPFSSNKLLEVRLLIFGSFLAFFLFHSLSWGFGLFGSMGMSRVLNAMVPLLSIISVIGFNLFNDWKVKGKLLLPTLVYIPLIGYLLIFPFLHNPASINWEKELCRSPEMILMHTIADNIKTQYPGKFLYYSNPYLSYSLNINPFDQSKHLCITDWQKQKVLKSNSLIIWDNWFSKVEERTDSTLLFQNTKLKLVNRFEIQNFDSKKVFLVFSN